MHFHLIHAHLVKRGILLLTICNYLLDYLFIVSFLVIILRRAHWRRLLLMVISMIEGKRRFGMWGKE